MLQVGRAIAIRRITREQAHDVRTERAIGSVFVEEKKVMAKLLRQQRHRSFGQRGFAGTGVAGKQYESGIGHIGRFQMIIKVVDNVF